MLGHFRLWHLASILECPLFGRYGGKADIQPEPEIDAIDPSAT